jgi:uncharacterized protein
METPAPAPHETPATPPRELDAAPVKHDMAWALLGEDGLRSGWAVGLFVAVFYLITLVLDTVAVTVDPALARSTFSPFTVLLGEALPVLALAGAGLFLARLQQRDVAAYHWRGPKASAHFAGGLVAGFAALTVLVGAMAAGGWLRFGQAALDGAHAAKYGAVWAVAFLLVGLFEEGCFRCFLLAALGRSINIWWALCAAATTCAVVALHAHPKGASGVYLVALLGLGPCAWLHWKRAEGSGFWQAAWVTSTAFGAYHTGNTGETAMGIFTASFIGFIFCVSVRLTGSAWWAIGCHAAWDWAETFFYGTADSGFATKGHLLTTTPQGNALWSGGAAGPEGSLLIVPVTLALLGALLTIYGRRRATQAAPETERLAG